MGLSTGHPHIVRTALIGLILSVLASSAFAQQPKILAPHDPIAPKVKKAFPLPPAVPGAMVGGPWMIDANFKSAIYLKNIVETSAITVVPVLHLSNGTKYQLPSVPIDAAGTAMVDINAALEKLGIAPYATLSGWVELQYTWGWTPLCAMIRNVDVVHSLIFTIGFDSPGADLSSKNPAASRVTEGIWWKQESNVTGFLTLANTTNQSLTALVQVSDNHASVIGTHSVAVSPQGMKTLNLVELQSAPTNEGGIRVSYVGQPDALLINGGLQDPAVGYSANLRFAPLVRPLPPMSHASEQLGITELGLMIGPSDPMMRFPSGTTFTPYSVLRNVSTGPISVTPTLWWMQAGAPASFQLPQFSLLPHETRTLDVASLLVAAGLKNFSGNLNLVFDTQGKSGLLMAGGSVDQTNTYVFEVGARGIVKSAGKSLSYWSTANGDDTMVNLWNPADEAQDFIFRLDFSGGHYLWPLHLEARASRSFNISQIIDTQVPDAEGNVIPASIQQGSAKVVGSQADNQNILVAVDSGVYNVKKAICGGSCQSCDGATSWSAPLNPFGVGVGAYQQESLTALYCSGSNYDFTIGSSWTSSNNGVATVQTGLVYGISPGTVVVSGGTQRPLSVLRSVTLTGAARLLQAVAGVRPERSTRISQGLLRIRVRQVKRSV